MHPHVVEDIPNLEDYYLPLSGGVMSGNIHLSGNELHGLGSMDNSGTQITVGDDIYLQNKQILNASNIYADAFRITETGDTTFRINYQNHYTYGPSFVIDAETTDHDSTSLILATGSEKFLVCGPGAAMPYNDHPNFHVEDMRIGTFGEIMIDGFNNKMDFNRDSYFTRDLTVTGNIIANNFESGNSLALFGQSATEFQVTLYYEDVVQEGGNAYKLRLSGAYTGSSNADYEIVIDSYSSGNYTFKWRKDTGAWTTGVSANERFTLLEEGIKVAFLSDPTTVPTVNDEYSFTALTNSTPKFVVDTLNDSVDVNCDLNTEKINAGNVHISAYDGLGSITFDGTGGNDITVAGTYTGTVDYDYEFVCTQVYAASTTGTISYSGVGHGEGAPTYGLNVINEYTSTISEKFYVKITREYVSGTASSISDRVFTGTGLTDMTIDDTSNYTGANDRNYVIKCTVAGVGGMGSSAGEFQWSSDGGSTWNGTDIVMTSNYDLGDGIELDFSDPSSADLNDQWTFTATAEVFSISEAFQWKTDSVTWNGTNLGTSGTDSLVDGISVSFASTNNKSLNDEWSFTVTGVEFEKMEYLIDNISQRTQDTPLTPVTCGNGLTFKFDDNDNHALNDKWSFRTYEVTSRFHVHNASSDKYYVKVYNSGITEITDLSIIDSFTSETGTFTESLTTPKLLMNPIIIGDTDTEAIGSGAIAIGHEAECGQYGIYGGIAIGSYAISFDTDSIAIGRNSDSRDAYTIAIGRNAIASAHAGIAIGVNANVASFGSVSNAIAIGSDSEAKGNNAIVIGEGANTTTLIDSIAIGKNASSLHTNSIALSTNTTTTADNQFKVGSITMDHLNNEIGITTDTDLMTMSDNKLTLAGDLYLNTLDLGTNTITDGAMTGNWNFGSGNLTTAGGLDLGGDLDMGTNNDILSSGAAAKIEIETITVPGILEYKAGFDHQRFYINDVSSSWQLNLYSGDLAFNRNSGTGAVRFTTDLNFQLDNLKIKLGTENDVEMYYDGSTFIIDNTDTGNISFVDNNLTTTGTFGAGNTTIDGVLTVDNTASDTFCVRKNGDTGDVFCISTDTPAMAVNGSLTMNGNTGIASAGDGIDITSGKGANSAGSGGGYSSYTGGPFTFVSGNGGDSSVGETQELAGNGGAYNLTAGNGGEVLLACSVKEWGGNGGAFNLSAGNGQIGTKASYSSKAGKGGALTFRGGMGAVNGNATGNIEGGAGGDMNFFGGNASDSSASCVNYASGSGGGINFFGGNGGQHVFGSVSGTSTGGIGGHIMFATGVGGVSAGWVQADSGKIIFSVGAQDTADFLADNSGLRFFDNVATILGTASDTSIYFDGSDLNIKSNDITANDELIISNFNSLTTTGVGRKKNTTRATTTANIAVTDDVFFGNTDGSSWVATLPVGVEGQTFKIINSGSSGKQLTVTPNGAQHLLGVNSSFILRDGETMIITYNTNDGWY